MNYRLTNSDKLPVRDLTFYRRQEEGWFTAAVGELSPTKTAKPASGPASRPATTQASTQPTGFSVTLAATGLTEASQVLAPWKQTLTAAGLPSTDFDLILKILEKHALTPKRLSAIYRLDADQLDQLLPLEIVPSARKVVRVGLVIVRNIDPAIASEIETLALQLGDAKWDVRESAQKQLTELGLAAKPKLEALLKNAKDPEITYRIERLLEGLNRAPTVPENPQGDR